MEGGKLFFLIVFSCIQ